ncbi:MAG: hypothetical protein ACLP2F_04595 [Steroidobacteraceae bacterium]
MIDLAMELPRLLPLAVKWAESRSKEILETGIALTPSELQLARSVGVKYTQRVRLKIVPVVPLPEDADLRAAALQAGLLGPSTQGLTLGYGIYLVEGFNCNQLKRHECRHVYQYEQAGSIQAFLSKYIPEVVQLGYENAPFEVDARAYENG